MALIVQKLVSIFLDKDIAALLTAQLIIASIWW